MTDRPSPAVPPPRAGRAARLFVFLLLLLALLPILAFVPWRRLLEGSRPREFTNSIGMKLVRIEPGEFWMGSPAEEEDRYDGEAQDKVKITKGFYLGATEVTQKQWRAVMGNDPSHFKGDDLPVEQVTWDDAIAFCRRLTDKESSASSLKPQAFCQGAELITARVLQQGDRYRPGRRPGLGRVPIPVAAPEALS